MKTNNETNNHNQHADVIQKGSETSKALVSFAITCINSNKLNIMLDATGTTLHNVAQGALDYNKIIKDLTSELGGDLITRAQLEGLLECDIKENIIKSLETEVDDANQYLTDAKEWTKGIIENKAQ